MMNKPYLWVIYLTLISVLMIECNHISDKKSEAFKVLAANPLCDFLTGEDSGGEWTIVTIPAGSTLANTDLIGDCPSIDFDLFGCGEYTLRYTVESTDCVGCTDFVDVDIIKCCISGSATCN